MTTLDVVCASIIKRNRAHSHAYTNTRKHTHKHTHTHTFTGVKPSRLCSSSYTENDTTTTCAAKTAIHH